MTAKKVTVKIAAEGGQQVKAEFQGLGSAGKAALQDVSSGMKNAAASAAVFEAALEKDAAAFQVLRAQLDPAIAAEQRWAQQKDVISRAVASGAATQDQANRALAQAEAHYESHKAALQSVSTGLKGSAASAAVFEAAIEKDAAAFQQLRAQLDPTIAAEQRFAQQKEVIRRAVQNGTATQRQATGALAQAEAQYRANIAGLTGFGRQMDLAAQNSRRMGYQMQNMGYQVGDVFVQLAAGTDITRALALQLPQMLGGFGAIGAVLGAVVAAGGAMAVMWGQADEKTKEITYSTGDLTGALSGLGEAEQRYSDLLKARRITQSSVSDAAIALAGREMEAKRALFEVERARADYEADKLRRSIAAIKSDLDRQLAEAQAKIASEIHDDPLGGAAGYAANPAAAQRLNLLQAALEAMRSQRLEVTKQQAELTLIEVTMARVNEAFARGAALIKGSVGATADQTTEVEKQAAAIQRNYIALGKSRREQATAQREAQAMLVALRAEADLNAIVARHGQDSRQATEARLTAERKAYQTQVDAMQVAASLKSALMGAWDAANGVASVDIAGNVRMAAAAAYDLASNLESALVRLAAIRDSAVASAQQRAELAQARIDTVGNPSARAGREAVINYRHSSELKDGGYGLLRAGNTAGFGKLGTRMQADEAQVRKAAEAATALETKATAADAAWRKLHDGKSGGGGGKGGAGDKDSIAARTQALLAEAKAIADANAAGRDYTHALQIQRQEHQLILEAQRAKVALTPEVLASIRAEAEAYVTAEEQLERLKSSTDRGRDALKGLFGAMLEGAESAKKAIANLLAEMAKVQFAKGMLGLLGGTSWGGKLIQGIGSLLTFDGGGETPYGPRSGGLDGKGGFLAMLHPRETVIDHTKGGRERSGGGPVSININVSGARGNQEIREMVEVGVRQGIDIYNRHLPSRMQQVGQNPRRR